MTELPGWLKHATVWLLLTAALFVGVRTYQAQQRAPSFEAAGSVVELRRGADGHYHWPGSIDGREVDFLSTPEPPARRCRRRWRPSSACRSSAAYGPQPPVAPSMRPW